MENRTCIDCGKNFECEYEKNGKRTSLSKNRQRCLECQPFGTRTSVIKTKICEGCNKEFDTRPIVDGRELYLHKRKKCLDCQPLGSVMHRPPRAVKSKSYTDDELREAVAASMTFSGALKYMHIDPTRGKRDLLEKHAKEIGLDISHFKKRSQPDRISVPLEERLVKGKYTGTHLKRRLFKAKLKEQKCENCGLTEWMGEPTPLELHHKDGDRWNNLIENLEILCPNCHSCRHKKKMDN